MALKPCYLTVYPIPFVYWARCTLFVMTDKSIVQETGPEMAQDDRKRHKIGDSIFSIDRGKVFTTESSHRTSRAGKGRETISELIYTETRRKNFSTNNDE